MVTILKQFERTDCLHYEVKQIKACCGRLGKTAGFCTIADPDGHKRNKVCSMKMGYCHYQPKEEDHVHTP